MHQLNFAHKCLHCKKNRFVKRNFCWRKFCYWTGARTVMFIQCFHVSWNWNEGKLFGWGVIHLLCYAKKWNFRPPPPFLNFFVWSVTKSQTPSPLKNERNKWTTPCWIIYGGHSPRTEWIQENRLFGFCGSLLQNFRH